MLRFIKNIFGLIAGRACAPGGAHPALRLILNRRSCRSFRRATLTDAELKAVLEAGRYTPSTVNLQTWSFITFSNDRWQASFGRPIPFQGAAAIVICADIHRLQSLLPELQDTPHINLCLAVFNAGLAAMSMTLAAEALGLRSIMLSETGRTGLLDYAFLRDKLSLPDGVVPLTTLVIGRGHPPGIGIPPRLPAGAVIMDQQYAETPDDALRSWFDQMRIGYKITHPLSNFEKQLSCYRLKMVEAEEDLRTQFGLHP